MGASDPVLCSIDVRGVAAVTLNRPRVCLASQLDAVAAERRHGTEAAESLASFRDKRTPRWYPQD